MSPLDELRMKREEMAGGFAMSMAMRADNNTQDVSAVQADGMANMADVSDEEIVRRHLDVVKNGNI